ncbi:MAG: hypothetical protein ACLRSW_05605 [Christensenellaceae bacterium]
MAHNIAFDLSFLQAGCGGHRAFARRPFCSMRFYAALRPETVGRDSRPNFKLGELCEFLDCIRTISRARQRSGSALTPPHNALHTALIWP